MLANSLPFIVFLFLLSQRLVTNRTKRINSRAVVGKSQKNEGTQVGNQATEFHQNTCSQKKRNKAVYPCPHYSSCIKNWSHYRGKRKMSGNEIDNLLVHKFEESKVPSDIHS